MDHADIPETNAEILAAKGAEKATATSSASALAVDKKWVRWLLAGNPFYPVSAGLVLLGVFLLSGEQRIFDTELRQLWFNLGAVSGYGFLMVFTAVWLYRRRVHYETIMLAVLVALPILTPFILISQAALIGGNVLPAACLVAAACAGTQFTLLRFRIPALPLGNGLGLFFGLILLANLAMPLVVHEWHYRLDAIRWAVFVNGFGPVAWELLLPILLVVGYAVRPEPARLGNLQINWLSAVWMFLLAGATVVHMSALCFVYSVPWSPQLLYPVLWLASWMVALRLPRWFGRIDPRMGECIAALPAFVGLVAWLDPYALSLSWLNLLNLTGCGFRCLLRGDTRFRWRVIATLSGIGWLRTVPAGLIHEWWPNLSRVDLMLLAVSIAIIAVGSWRRQPVWSFLTALAVVRPLQFFWLTNSADWPVVGQLALSVCWFMSFRWHPDRSDARSFRRLVFGFWWAHSILWLLRDGGHGAIDLSVFAFAFLISSSLGIWGGAPLRNGWFAVLSVVILSMRVAPFAIELLAKLPTGLLVLGFGVISFGVGTSIAIWRGKWFPTPAPSEADGQNL